jgi:DNA (cytosine-5)-methyltransferase 1
MNMGGRIIGLPPMTGYDLDTDACATGRAAGFERVQADIRTLDPREHAGVTGAVITTPCPTLSESGKRTGREDLQLVLDSITCMGVDCGCDWETLPWRVQDVRTALLVEAARWALFAPDLEWIVCENVPAARFIWEDLCAELAAAGWEIFDVINIQAADYGVPSRRPRSFLYARRCTSTRVTQHDAGWNGADMPGRTMAQALGWEPGIRIWTRGQRKTSGGNAFSADKPSWCLTGSTRSWRIGAADGPELTAAQAGLLNGFPLEYPWQGSRTKKFLQVADVVSPVVAAVVLGVATDTPWVEPVTAYLESLYGSAPAVSPARSRFEQLDLLVAA